MERSDGQLHSDMTAREGTCGASVHGYNDADELELVGPRCQIGTLPHTGLVDRCGHPIRL